MIDYMDEILNSHITELKFTMNGKALRVKNTAIVNGNCMEFSLANDRKEVRGIHPDWKIDHSSTKTQQQHIREYLESGRAITPLEALEMFGCLRLGAQIFALKKKGLPIEMQMKKDENTGKHYAVYFIAPASPKD